MWTRTALGDSRASAPGRRPGLKGRIFSSGRVPTQEVPAKKRKGNEGAVDSARAEFIKQLPPEICKKIKMGVQTRLWGLRLPLRSWSATLHGIALDPSS